MKYILFIYSFIDLCSLSLIPCRVTVNLECISGSSGHRTLVRVPNHCRAQAHTHTHPPIILPVLETSISLKCVFGLWGKPEYSEETHKARGEPEGEICNPITYCILEVTRSSTSVHILMSACYQ